MTSYPKKSEKTVSDSSSNNLKKTRTEVKSNNQVSEVVTAQIEHCLGLVQQSTVVIDLSCDVDNKVLAIAPHLVRMADGSDASSVDFFEEALFSEENGCMCKVTFDSYLEKSVEQRCLPCTVIKKSTIQVLDFCFELGYSEMPEGFSCYVWAEKSVEWAQNVFGEENIMLAVLHGDEGVPHIHLLITPIINGRFIGSAFGGGGRMNKKTRDSYKDAMKEIGLFV